MQYLDADESISGNDRTLISRVEEITEEDIKMAMPIEKGKIILLSKGIRYEFYIYTKTGLYRCEGEVLSRYKLGNIYMVSVGIKTQFTKHQRREYFRLSCVLDINYKLIKDEIPESEWQKIIQNKIEYLDSDDLIKGIVVDISGGGFRFISYQKIEIGSYICFRLQIELNNQVKVLNEIGKVISSERIETDQERKYENRLRFEYMDTKNQEMIIKYVFETERKKVNRKRD